MADTSKSDFCIDIESTNELIKVFENTFTELSRKQTDLNVAFQNATASDCLKGDWYDSFLQDYQKWSTEYNRLLAGAIVLTSCLYQTVSSANYLIEERDRLTDKMKGS